MLLGVDLVCTSRKVSIYKERSGSKVNVEQAFDSLAFDAALSTVLCRRRVP